MENKELIINIPEGYEIDKKQSTFEKIVFKKKLVSAYSPICRKIFKTGFYYIGNNGTIKEFDNADNIEYVIEKHPEILEQLNNAPTKDQLEQLLAINKLMNVAYYLNNGWEPTWDNEEQKKYYIYYYKPLNKFKIEFCSFFNCGRVYFKSKELAEQAIKILGENVLKTIFGV